MPRYVHYPLNVEIRSIGGFYKVLEEGILDVDGQKVLYALKGAHVETSCCGSGGVGFISVPGVVTSWKSGKDENGNPVSEVKHITSTKQKDRIRALLKQRFPYVNMVDFE